MKKRSETRTLAVWVVVAVMCIGLFGAGLTQPGSASATVRAQAVTPAPISLVIEAPRRVAPFEMFTVRVSGVPAGQYAALSLGSIPIGTSQANASGVATLQIALYEPGGNTIEATVNGAGPAVSKTILVATETPGGIGYSISYSVAPNETSPVFSRDLLSFSHILVQPSATDRTINDFIVRCNDGTIAPRSTYRPTNIYGDGYVCTDFANHLSRVIIEDKFGEAPSVVTQWWTSTSREVHVAKGAIVTFNVPQWFGGVNLTNVGITGPNGSRSSSCPAGVCTVSNASQANGIIQFAFDGPNSTYGEGSVRVIVDDATAVTTSAPPTTTRTTTTVPAVTTTRPTTVPSTTTTVPSTTSPTTTTPTTTTPTTTSPTTTVPSTNVPTTTRPTTTVTTSAPQPGAACRAVWTVNWDNGSQFGASLTVTNIGAKVKPWLVSFTWARTQRLDGLWGGSGVQRGRTVTVSSPHWLRSLAPGAAAPIGLNGTGPSNRPSAVRLNGKVCAFS